MFYIVFFIVGLFMFPFLPAVIASLIVAAVALVTLTSVVWVPHKSALCAGMGCATLHGAEAGIDSTTLKILTTVATSSRIDSAKQEFTVCMVAAISSYFL